MAPKPSAFRLALFFALLCGTAAAAEDPARPDYASAPSWFPRVYTPYVRRDVHQIDLANTSAVSQMIRDGRLHLSLAQMLAAVAENNLDLAIARFNTSVAQTDILRAKSGQAPRGSDGAPIPSGLFAGAIGAGLGGGGGTGGIGGGGGVSGSARAVTISPRGSFDPTLVVNFSQDRTTSPLNTTRISGIPIVTNPTTFLQASYQQAFTSATSFSLAFSNQRQSSTQQFLLYNPSFVSRYSFSLTQQLLNGFGFAVTRRFLTVARNNQQIAEEVFRQTAATTLTQSQNLYWDLVAARENVGAAEQALKVSERLLDDNQKRLEIGTLAQLDVTSAESEVAARRRDLILAETDSQTKELALKVMISKRIDSDLAAAHIETADPLPQPKDADIPRLAEALATAFKNRPELRQAERMLANQETVVRFTRSGLKPTLVAFGFFASSGLSGNRTITDPGGGPSILIPGGITQAFGQVFRIDHPEYAAGITLTIPLRNRSAQADNARARLEERQSETALQQTRQRIDLEVRKAIIGLIQTKARVESASKAAELASKLVDAEQRKMQEGVSTPYAVIQLQRDFISAQRVEVQARVDYAKALVEMTRSTGSTLENLHIAVEDLLRH